MAYFAIHYSKGRFGGLNDPGNNQLYNNGKGVAANNNSGPIIGLSQGQGNILGGDNCVFDNSFDLYATNISFISAQFTYWDETPVYYADASSGFDNRNPLRNCPPGGIGRNIVGTDDALPNGGLKDGNDPNGGPDGWLGAAYLHWFNGSPAQALAILQRLISHFPHEWQAQQALVTLAHIYWENQISGLSQYLLSVLADPLLQPLVSDLLIRAFAEEGDLTQAIAQCQSIMQQYPDTEQEKHAWYSLFHLYFNELNDMAQAQNVFAALQADYPEADETQQAALELGLDATTMTLPTDTNAPDMDAVNSAPTNVIHDFFLAESRPNPFNQQTVIQYQVGTPLVVSLRVYNAAGQLVRTLVNEPQAAGAHEVMWDGANEQGRTVASGLYFYRLEAETFAVEKRMLFLK